MKKVLVLSSALRTSGGKTIYIQFLQYLKLNIKNDEYLVVKDSDMIELPIDGVKYVNVDTTSYIKRIYFDFFGVQKLLKDLSFSPDIVVSLQNTGSYALRSKPQIVYYHNPIALFDYKWNYLKKEDRDMLMYKYVYPRIVKLSTNNKTHFVVQTSFIHDEFIEYYGVPSYRVHILFPDIKITQRECVKRFEYNCRECHFIYPATPKSFKRHIVIAKALDRLKQDHPDTLTGVKVHLSLNNGDLEEFDKYIDAKGLKENFIYEGVVSYEQLLEKYNSCDALLFPSVVETLGLPLVEAASFGMPVLVSDEGYSRSVIGRYEGAKFIKSEDYDEWAYQIYCIAESKPKFKPYRLGGNSSWLDFFKLIEQI